MIGVYAFIALLIGRNVYLQIVQHDFFLEKSQRQLKRLFTIAPHRGHIYDRHHNPFTINLKSYSIYAKPPLIEDKTTFAKKVTHFTGGSWSQLEKKLQTKSPFVWIRRKGTPAMKQQLETLDLKGIGFIQEPKRSYPKGTSAAHLLGFVGIDNQGLSGFEYTHDTFLKGTPGKIMIEGDPRGNRLISGEKITFPPYDGGNIITTLDEIIQYSAEKHLSHAVSVNQALKGSAIVMDPKTGDILAMANAPEFDPNTRPKTWDGTRKNRCITDMYEPGSTFKIITLAAVLEEGLYDETSILEVPEFLRVAKHTISEAHRRPEEDDAFYTVSEIIEQSLNVGVSLMSQKLGEEKLYRYIRSFGFGDRTHIALPGEAKGMVRAPKDWSGLDFAMFSFGQGLAVTPLQMITSMTILSNNGRLVKPRIISYKSSHKGHVIQGNPKTMGKQIVSSKTVDAIKRIMHRTVEQGTGQIVKLKGYPILGKTGTAQKAKENGRGYEKGKYVASFLGGFPAQNPDYLILVVIDSPNKGRYYGSSVAGPVFKNILKDIIRYKQIPPDYAILKKP